MTRYIAAAAMVAAFVPAAASAQRHDHDLHVSSRWKDCAFQLDAGLTRDAWRQFSREAGLVIYFRPLSDAAPLGAGNFEVGVMQATIGIDDHDAAWNDTFVHPDSEHVLFEGSGLPVPGIVGRVGVTDRVDVGAYLTQNPNSNYGVVAGQVQYSLPGVRTAIGIDAAARASASTLFGPEDVDVAIFGLDLIASRRYQLPAGVSIAPYGAVSAYLTTTRENSAVVELPDERHTGVHAMAGAVARYSILQVAFEYDAARVDSRTLKIGVAF